MTAMRRLLPAGLLAFLVASHNRRPSARATSAVPTARWAVKSRRPGIYASRC